MRKRAEPHTFEQRLQEQKQRLEQKLSRLPSGQHRDRVAAQIEQLKAAADMHDFLSPRQSVR